MTLNKIIKGLEVPPEKNETEFDGEAVGNSIRELNKPLFTFAPISITRFGKSKAQDESEENPAK